jgi:TPR repeat protein
MQGNDNKSLAERAWVQGCALEDQEKFEDAAAEYLIAAELGHAFAQSNLGNLFDDKLTPRNSEKAVYWYEKSVQAGNHIGAWNLAMHYRNDGDEELGLHWMKIAANMGHEDAQQIMSRLKTIVR